MTRIIHLLTASVLLAGCGGDRTVLQPNGLEPEAPSEAHTMIASEIDQDIATLRLVTAAYHDTATAAAAGWNTRITGCMSDAAGGMGFHYGNVGLIDGSVRVDQPELLMYEPEKNGQMRLVAVEYIVPLSAWSSSEPPRLFGRDFHVNTQFQVWALHVWAWRENPNGMFADWNPNVSCQYAASAATH